MQILIFNLFNILFKVTTRLWHKNTELLRVHNVDDNWKFGNFISKKLLDLFCCFAIKLCLRH